MTECLDVIATGSPAARDVGKLVSIAHNHGWDVHVTVSPQAVRFVDRDALAAQTGHPVLSEYADVHAVRAIGDAVIAAPITCNSLAKWAAGISDTLALGLLVEAVAFGRPVVAMPFSHRVPIHFPAVQEAMTRLAGWGVTLVAGDELYDHGGAWSFPWELSIERFPWGLAWEAMIAASTSANGRSPGGRSPAAEEAEATRVRRPRP